MVPLDAANPTWDVAELANELGLGPKAVRAALDEQCELSLRRESVERGGQFHPVSPGAGRQLLVAR